MDDDRRNEKTLKSTACTTDQISLAGKDNCKNLDTTGYGQVGRSEVTKSPDMLKSLNLI